MKICIYTYTYRVDTDCSLEDIVNTVAEDIKH